MVQHFPFLFLVFFLWVGLFCCFRLTEEKEPKPVLPRAGAFL